MAPPDDDTAKLLESGKEGSTAKAYAKAYADGKMKGKTVYEQKEDDQKTTGEAPSCRERQAAGNKRAPDDVRGCGTGVWLVAAGMVAALTLAVACYDVSYHVAAKKQASVGVASSPSSHLPPPSPRLPCSSLPPPSPPPRFSPVPPLPSPPSPSPPSPVPSPSLSPSPSPSPPPPPPPPPPPSSPSHPSPPPSPSPAPLEAAASTPKAASTPSAATWEAAGHRNCWWGGHVELYP